MSGEARKIANDARVKLMLRRIIDGGNPKVIHRLMRPHMRPHTWVFLRQQGIADDPVTCLGIVFHEWPRNKYNMINFTSQTNTGEELKTSGLLTPLDNGQTGLVLKVRWPWGAMLKQYKGLSDGNL
jgi:hypothetical protein